MRSANPGDRRRNARLGVAYDHPPPPHRAFDLTVYPPETDNVRLGVQVVLDGAYDIKGLTFATSPVILDCGAHIGSFSVWASHRWPGARIHAYEPSPDNASYCRRNVAPYNVELQQVALVGPGKPARLTLFNGVQNTGQRSIYRRDEQRTDGVEVATFSAAELPPGDILKLDTEGCELEILRAYQHLARVRALMIEWHSTEDYAELRRWLPTLGFRLLADSSQGRSDVPDRNLIFLRPVAPVGRTA